MIRLLLPLFSILLFAISSNVDAQVLRKIKERRYTDVTKDISYGNYERQKLDIYSPSKLRKKLLPVHIFIHGGAWQMGDKNKHDDLGHFYASNKIVTVAINYRLSPENKHPAQVEDCAEAIKWVYDHIEDYGGDPNNIHLSGHSAGAHLAALVATNPKYLAKHKLKPSLLKTVMPVDTASFDFNTRIKKGRRFIQSKIDETFGTDRKDLAQASPITHARRDNDLPPFILFVTSERPDAVLQTQKFHVALQKAGAYSMIYIIPELSHREMSKAMRDHSSVVSKVILKKILDD